MMELVNVLSDIQAIYTKLMKKWEAFPFSAYLITVGAGHIFYIKRMIQSSINTTRKMLLLYEDNSS